MELLKNLGGVIANSIRSGYQISCPLGLLALREFYSNRLKNKHGYNTAKVKFIALESELKLMFATKAQLQNAYEQLFKMADAFMSGFMLIMSQGGVETLLNSFSVREFEYFFTARIRKEENFQPVDIASMDIQRNFENYEASS